MKKLIALLLAMVLCLSLCACGGKQAAEANGSAEAQTPEETEAAEDEASGAEFYGTWHVVTAALPSGDFTPEEMENSKTYTMSDWSLVISETGKLYLQTQNNSVVSDFTMTDTSVTGGSNVWNYENNQLVLTSGDSKFFYEKESDSQEFPDPQKADLLAMLAGTWNLQSSERTGSFVFDGNSCTATINGVVIDANMLAILTDRNQVKINAVSNGTNVTLSLDYTLEGDTMTLVYSGDALVKQ